MRIEMNEHYAAWFERLSQSDNLMDEAPLHPAALDLRFSNLCNFKCRNCSHRASSKWYSDAKKLGWPVGATAEIHSFGSVRDVIDQISAGLEYLDEIYFAGGEPLIQEEHYALLRLLCERGLTDVRLSYHTNLSVTRFAGNSAFDLWNRFGSVSVVASIDASGERGAYARSGFSWQNFIANVKELKHQCPRVKLRFGITVSSLNIQSLPELLRSLSIECGASPDQFHVHSLQTPRHYRTQILPVALKRLAAENIKTYLDELYSARQYSSDELDPLREALLGLLSYMNASDLSEEVPVFTAITERLDELRSENLSETFPELTPLVERLSVGRGYLLSSKRLLRRAINKLGRNMGLTVIR